VIDNLVATVAQVASVDVNMQVSVATEVVTVQSKNEELDRSTSDVSTLIAPQEVQNIPLQQRATENLLAFIPGVVHGGAGNQPSTSQLSINGSRTLNTEVLLNGVSTIIASTGAPATLPSPDGVDQFRVLTTNAPAEYGRTSGAAISVNTISGTNKYHGNLYFLIRNEAFDANQYFHKDTIINLATGAVQPRNHDRFFPGRWLLRWPGPDTSPLQRPRQNLLLRQLRPHGYPQLDDGDRDCSNCRAAQGRSFKRFGSRPPRRLDAGPKAKPAANDLSAHGKIVPAIYW
jgi:hypothetical protein